MGTMPTGLRVLYGTLCLVPRGLAAHPWPVWPPGYTDGWPVQKQTLVARHRSGVAVFREKAPK